ncbi:hypothetical protein [Tenacibaculum sp. 190524A02b]|uniref:hypothetical protein n=1 Tax=Tenacibaculum vairaonense TaxID=3137860 RepID=UPI0031FA4B20
MKLSSLTTIEKINKEELAFVNGGTGLKYNHTRGHDTLRNDSQKQDGGASGQFKHIAQ